MVEVENFSYESCNEAYCLIMAYIREDKVLAKYNKEHLKEFAEVIHKMLKNIKNFAPEVVVIEDTGNEPEIPVAE